MAFSLREFIKHSIFIRHFHCLKTQITPISHLHGRPWCSSSELRSGDQRRPRRERWLRRQQMCLFNGSSLPLPRHNYFPPHRRFYSSHSEVPYLLSHTFSRPFKFALQEEMLVLSSRVLNSREFSGFSNGISEKDEEIEDDGNSESENVESEAGGVNSAADPKEVKRVCKVFEDLFTSEQNMGKDLDQCGIDLSHDLFTSEQNMEKDLGVQGDTFNCLLDVLGEAKLGKEAQALFEKLKDGFPLELWTYPVIILARWCQLKKLIEVERVRNEMVDEGLKHGIVAHNTLLEGLLRDRRRSEAIKLFETMKAKGPSPNARSYTFLIRDLCKGNEMEEAVEFFDKMLDSNCQPDTAVYTFLIVGFSNQRKTDKIYGLLKEMKEKGCPHQWAYNVLIKLMANPLMPDDDVGIYKKMMRSGLQPTIQTYNRMMKSYFQVKNYKMGCAVWDEMDQKGFCPHDTSYTIFIGELIRPGRSEEACKYMEEMAEKAKKAPQLDCTKFAVDSSRARKSDKLEELAQKMMFSGDFEASNVFASLRGGLRCGLR